MAATQMTLDTPAQALATELAAAWTTRLGAAAGLKPAAGGPVAGWLVTLPAEGGAAGTVSVCADAAAAAAVTRLAQKLDADPTDEAVSTLLGEIVTQAAGAFLPKSGHADATLRPATVAKGGAPATATVFDLEVGGKAVGKLAVSVDLSAAAAAAPANSQRLEAVLDVDLPLVVRFGRATMPLRSLAVLGPGSVIDMGRSPDEPVELLVGDRVIARGEVVIVGGNYGVRITELTGSQPAHSELEARTA